MPPPNSGPHKTTAAGVPPYPATNSASSTAAIAANTTLPGGRSLAINEKSGTNWTLTNGAGTTPNVPTKGTPIVQPIPRDTTGPVAASNPATISVPVATSNPVPANNPVTAGNPGTVANPAPTANVGTTRAPAGPIIATGSWSLGAEAPPKAAPATPIGSMTPDTLQATLQGKGAVGLKKEDTPEGVRVSCYVPQRSNPANLQFLETVAPDYATALQALVQQIDQGGGDRR